MGTATFGLIGVVVGALVTGGADYLMEHRREQRAMRAATRMLELELIEARDFIKHSIGQGRWLAEPLRVLSNDQWIEHRGT